MQVRIFDSFQMWLASVPDCIEEWPQGMAAWGGWTTGVETLEEHMEFVLADQLPHGETLRVSSDYKLSPIQVYGTLMFLSLDFSLAPFGKKRCA